MICFLKILNKLLTLENLLKIYGKQCIRNIIIPFIRLGYNKKYIFIVGCYNSGTTLLDNIIASHDEISNLPTEGVALTGELRDPKEYGWNRMWYMCREKLEISRLNKKPDPVRIKKEWSFWFDPDKEFWLEKSIINSLNIDWFEENFDHPYFIWIIRNGYAVAEGIKRRTQKKRKHPDIFQNGYPIEMCAKQWVVSNQVIKEKLSKVKNSYKITYEELTTNLIDTVKGILEWLPVKSKTIEMPSNFTFHKQSKMIRNMNFESINRLKKEEIKAINSVAKDMLIQHGYKILQ